ncbi:MULTISPECIES: hypothetical protein [unclassified Micromonospora]
MRTWRIAEHAERPYYAEDPNPIGDAFTAMAEVGADIRWVEGMTHTVTATGMSAERVTDLLAACAQHGATVTEIH